MKLNYRKMFKIGRMFHFRHRKIVLVVFILKIYILILWTFGPQRSVPQTGLEHPLFKAENLTDYKIQNNLKLILIWTRMQTTYTQWNMFPGAISQSVNREMEQLVVCKNQNCVVTYNKRHLADSDAVLLSLYDLKVYLALGPVLSWIVELLTFGFIDIYSTDGLPRYKPNGQKWILFWGEPPNIILKYTSWVNILKPLDDWIDWTVSFRKDSTIQRPYCYPVARDTNMSFFMNNYYSRFPRRKSSKLRPALTSYNEPPAEPKVVKILWFVSNCNSASKRETFVEALSKEPFIQVDIYGACGSLKCDKSSGDYCFGTLLPKYDFYLSLENEVCPDYITEKLCSILNHKIIPIVIGGANYNEMAPPRSVIDVGDFLSVMELAKYLRLLVSNRGEYEKFFEWKTNFRIEGRVQSVFSCDLCNLINQKDPPPKEKMSSWWNKRKCNNSWQDLMQLQVLV